MAIAFSSKTDAYREFSNFHQSPMVIDGLPYKTVEHFFQSQKFPTSPELQAKIRDAPTPVGAKRMGKKSSPHFRADWDQVKEEIMLKGLKAKFQDPALAVLLKSTGTAFLQEASPWDSYWGTGKGCGRNRMGILLMQVRTSLSS